MNIFFLDMDVKKCAKYHVDKHVVKKYHLKFSYMSCGPSKACRPWPIVCER